MSQPPIQFHSLYDTHRLIPSKYSDPVDPGPPDSVLGLIADDDDHLSDIYRLDHATNDRLLAENDILPGIGRDELVFGVPYHRIINASFTHASPLGSRFNSPDRGVWYAGVELKTAQAEVIWHRIEEYREVGFWYDDPTYDDYLADFVGDYHDLTETTEFEECLDPMSYVTSQSLAQGLLTEGSAGIVYPSVRNAGGLCLVCFRPVLVTRVRKVCRYLFKLNGRETPSVELQVEY